MSTEKNKALIRRFYDQVMNAGDLDAIDELFAADFIDHNARPNQPGGRESMRHVVAILREGFPDLHAVSDVMLAEGEYVAERWSSSGRHLGRFMGVPPTGKQIVVRGINIFRIVGNKITERWLEWDREGLIRQLSGTEAPSLFPYGDPQNG